MQTKWDITRKKATADIINAAIQEFAEKGYTGATTRSIAAQAGVSNGLIGKYFGSKEKLLCAVTSATDPNTICSGLNGEDPYSVFNRYMEHIRTMQKEDLYQFNLHLRFIINNDFPDSIIEIIRKGFTNSVMEDAIRTAQRDGELMSGEPFDIFRTLSGSVYLLLHQYFTIGIPAPDNDAILNIIGYNRKEKLYRQQKVKMTEMEYDLQMLMSAIRETYPLSISINLTQNTYHMIDYDNFSTRKAAVRGNYDDLIRVGASTVPDEKDREKFRMLFDRKNLLEAFANGERERSLLHLQTGDDGVNHWMSTRCMMKENADGDILAISIGGIVDDSVRRETSDILNRKVTLGEILRKFELEP